MGQEIQTAKKYLKIVKIALEDVACWGRRTTAEDEEEDENENPSTSLGAGADPVTFRLAELRRDRPFDPPSHR